MSRISGLPLLLLAFTLAALLGIGLLPAAEALAADSAGSSLTISNSYSSSTVVSSDGWEWSNPLPQSFSLFGIWGSSGSDVYAVGNYGIILHYDGSSWSEMDSGTTSRLQSIWGSSASHIFAVGTQGTILYFNGSTWSQMDSGTANELTAIWGSSDSNVFAAGYNGTILHYDGASWRPMSNPAPTDIYSGVWGSTGSDVFVAGYNGIILHYDGNSWSQMSSVTNAHFLGVWGSSRSDVFAVGEDLEQNGGDIIYHYDGNSWHQMSSGLGYFLTGIWGSSSSSVFAVGYYGTLLHYNGNTWSEMKTGTTSNPYLYGIWGSSASDFFAVGEDGVILHFNHNLNHAPVAANDNYSIDADTTLTVSAPGVLGNDTDSIGDNLKAVKVTDPTHGNLIFNEDGAFSYSPSTHWSGVDSFTYKAFDGQYDSNTAVVAITVNAGNIPEVRQLAFITGAQDITAGSVSQEIIVQAQDDSGTPLEVDSDLTIHLASTSVNGRFDARSNGPFDGSTTSVIILRGNSQASLYYKDTLSGTATINAANTEYIQASQAETIKASEAISLAVSGFPSSIITGRTGTITVTARDEFSNTADSYGGTIYFTSSDNEAILPADYTFSASDAGTHRFKVTLNTLGKQSITITDTEQSGLNITQNNIVVKKPVQAGSSGGGGNETEVPQLLTVLAAGLNTNMPVTMSIEGITNAAARYQTADGKLMLDITAGTKLTNSAGKVLTTLSAALITVPPSPPPDNAILWAYELGPEGSNFTPSLTLTFSYGTLPEGAKSLSLMFWNGSNWKQVEAAVDAAKGTITASVSHFSKYALIYQLPSPAGIAFTGITISPQTIKPDEKVTIQASVTNSGDLSGSYKLVLKINDRQVDSKEVTVAGGKTETVSFEVQRGMEGEYSVDVNGQKGRFTVGTPVETPPPATVAEAAATPTPEKTNDPVPVATTKPVTNTVTATAPVLTGQINPGPFPAAASASLTEDKPASPVLWIVLGAVAVTILVSGTLIYQARRRNQI